MYRMTAPERPGWRQTFEELGFSFHSMEGGYWSEGICYQFNAAQIDLLEEVSDELHAMCLQAVEHVVAQDLFARIGLNEQAAALARSSWQRQEISLYGRFDLVYDGHGDPKLLEYNADTPTALYEASIAQWVWLEELYPDCDQFNSIHEKLLDAFAALRQRKPLAAALYFSCVKEHEEDRVTVDYLRDVAMQAGIDTRFVHIEDIGYNPEAARFIDLDDLPMQLLFKLYPWEWLLSDEFAAYLREETISLIEPAWKMILSTKGILPILWELFPGHKNLLPSFFEPAPLGDRFVKKPMFAREGANVELVDGGARIAATEGSYGREGYIYQALQPLPEFSGRYPVIGSWIVNGLAAGIGLREDESPITKNTSRFVPHYFID